MDTMLMVAGCFCGWGVLYRGSCFMGPGLPHACHIRVVTVIHALMVVSLSAWCLLIQGPWVFTDPGGPNTPLQHVTVSICLSYFLFDFLWCLYFKTEGAFMLFHHLLSLFGNSMTLYYGKYGTELVATIFGTEITNPFLQLRWFLRKSGRGSTWYAEINDFFFMCLFGSMRIVVGGYLLYCYLNHPLPDWLGRFGGISMYMVSWGFWVMIVQYAVSKYAKMWKTRRGRSRKNGSLSNGVTRFSDVKSSNGNSNHNDMQENGHIKSS